MEQKANLLFEDEDIFVMTSPEPTVAGQVSVLPKQHAPILEAVPDEVVGKMFNAANKASVGIFEALGSQGTNIIVKNGPAAGQTHNHTMINVVPRFDNDQLKIGWEPKKVEEEELDDAESKLKGEVQEKPSGGSTEEIEEEDYRVKALNRIP